MYLTAENLVHYLLSRGLVAPSGVVDGDFTALESRRRNRNYRVMRRHDPSLFIKQVPMVVAETTAALNREAACYRMAAEAPELAPLQALMPRLLDYNPVNHTIVTELLPGGENLNEYHQRIGSFPESAGELQAIVLARLHSGTANVLPRLDEARVFHRVRPWLFTILQNAETVMPNATAPMMQVVTLLRQQPDLVAALAAMQDNWQQTSLIHGDVKWDNFVLAGNELRLVDWELADIGDAAWDIACVFASYVQPWLFTFGDGTLQGPVATRGATISVTWPAIRAFWRTYAREMNLSPVAAELQLLRAAYYTGGRLLLTAFEMSNGAMTVPSNVGPIVELARHALRDPQTALRDLLGLAETPAEPKTKIERADVEVPPATRERLEALFRGVEILSPTSFRFAGHGPVDAANADLLAEGLWPVLYNACYTRDYRGGTAVRTDAGSMQNDPEFVAMLSAANRARTRWDPSWEVYQLGANGGVHVKKGNAYRVANPGEYAHPAGPGLPAAIGARVDLLVLRESHVLQQGFYFAFSETVSSDFDDAQLTRIYFNATADGTGGILELLSTSLNRFAVPYRFKCLDNRAAYSDPRADSTVLYVARRFAPLALSILGAARETLAPLVHPQIPLFAKELLPGVSAADEPGTGESFGQSRMRLVAHGIVDAWSAGKVDVRSRFDAVESRFRAAGLTLARPYLNHGNSDVYDIPGREVSH